ncbi:MAG: aminotransferase class V-fold PLP-dependent enzyme, partial [Chthoniobacterales bacterium]
MIYLDYNATTPLASEAMEAMLPYLREEFGNPSSIHAQGRSARAAVDDARDCLAKLLGAKPHEIIFTGGGTEADNLAIIGLARERA